MPIATNTFNESYAVSNRVDSYLGDLVDLAPVDVLVVRLVPMGHHVHQSHLIL